MSNIDHLVLAIAEASSYFKECEMKKTKGMYFAGKGLKRKWVKF